MEQKEEASGSSSGPRRSSRLTSQALHTKGETSKASKDKGKEAAPASKIPSSHPSTAILPRERQLTPELARAGTQNDSSSLPSLNPNISRSSVQEHRFKLVYQSSALPGQVSAHLRTHGAQGFQRAERQAGKQGGTLYFDSAVAANDTLERFRHISIGEHACRLDYSQSNYEALQDVPLGFHTPEALKTTLERTQASPRLVKIGPLPSFWRAGKVTDLLDPSKGPPAIRSSEQVLLPTGDAIWKIAFYRDDDAARCILRFADQVITQVRWVDDDEGKSLRPARGPARPAPVEQVCSIRNRQKLAPASGRDLHWRKTIPSTYD
ncbi:unnamed protein product [Tilletia caries]|nr:unnamed protein product [Tilletia caries]